MSANHRRQHALGRWTGAVAGCAGAAMTGLMASGAVAGPVPGSPDAASSSVQTTLTSAGTGGVAAAAPNARAAISADGRYVAFQSQANVPTSASVQVTIPQSAGNWRVYVRDQAGQVTSLLSNPGAGKATAPGITANGKLVSYLLDDGTSSDVVVVNRQATGKGAFDTPPNLAVSTVTGTSNDLEFERITGCPSGIAAAAAVRTTPCGPRLSADGSTLVYPAQLSPVSPELGILDSGDPSIAGNLVDFGLIATGSGTFNEQQVSYTVQGSQPVTFTGVTTTGPFSLVPQQPSPACAGTLVPGNTCNAFVSFNDLVCPGTGTAMFTGTLQTNATTPAGQSSLTLVALCEAGPGGAKPFTVDADAGAVPAGARPPALGGCPALPTGLPMVKAPAPEQDNDEFSLTDLGQAVIGLPYVTTVPFSTSSSATFQFASADCGLQLVSPASLGLPPGGPPACVQNELFEAAGSCTAYVLVTPASVGTDTASLLAAQPALSAAAIATYLTVTGVSDVIVARHDKTGTGHFAAAPSTVVSVDGSGNVMPAASQPSVSATGRYVAFTAPVPAGQAGAQAADDTSVWRHDTDASGNRTYRPGATIMVSCLPGGPAGSCHAAPDADSPSLSGDGSQAAFATIAVHGQVYARNIAAAATALVSMPAGGKAGGDSYAPAMSQDGSTVAYISTATDLSVPAAPTGAANLFVRNLLPGAPSLSELVSASGGSLPAGDDIALPDIDAHGGLVTVQTSQRLLPSAPPGVTSIYTFERLPALRLSPAPVSFGTVPAEAAGEPQTVTVTDLGPGPGTVLGTGVSLPFGLNGGSCAGAVLHEGASCALTASLPPEPADSYGGGVTVTVTGDDGPVLSFSAPVTASVAPAPPPPSLPPTPSVSPPPTPPPPPPPPVLPGFMALTLSPSVAPPGQVTQVTGTGFTAGEHVTLSWQPGLGQASVVAGPDGGFTVTMVIFTDDFTGPRVLQARDASGQLLATADFLVQQPSVEPPFTSAGAVP